MMKKIQFMFVLLILQFAWSHAVADPDALKKAIQEACLGKTVDKAKCLAVEDGAVVFRTQKPPYHYLLVPINHIAGIESPEFWQNDYPSWFTKAWKLRHLSAPWMGTNKTNSDVAIALNSKLRRTQDQLHIHMNCVRPEVIDVLKDVPQHWTTVVLQNRDYQAIKLPGANLPDSLNTKLLNLFPDIATKFDRQTLFAVQIGENVVFLRGEYDPKDQYSGCAQDLMQNCS